VDPQPGGGVLGRLVAPELIDQPVSGDGFVRVEEEGGEKRTQLGSSDGYLGALVAHLERSEDPEVHPCSSFATELKQTGSIVALMPGNRVKYLIAVPGLATEWPC
jgi:hypothetical protein